MARIEYHLRELDIALNREDPRHCMPDIAETDKAILDIGCGIGQLFIASKLSKDIFAVGVDIDLESLRYGIEQYRGIHYINSNSESLPFHESCFDLVVSRLSLPYTNIPQVITEINRVLKAGGRIWISLHASSMQRMHLLKSVRHLDVKDTIFRIYVLLNGFFLHWFGKVVPFPLLNKYESFQTSKGMARLLRANRFTNLKVTKEKHFVVTGIKTMSHSIS